jgi:hypothetical protein
VNRLSVIEVTLIEIPSTSVQGFSSIQDFVAASATRILNLFVVRWRSIDQPYFLTAFSMAPAALAKSSGIMTG